ncbi:DivIVA domain-containing protein [Actinomadura scrupuli]|uniref:DivIVA domain-containing protein n=1 Tax=Actinomadura scrupuli TaxID=559629 RepID=UPI003D98B1F5
MNPLNLPAANLPATRGEASRLSPAELQSVHFGKAALGRRGYDEQQVDYFFERVQRELLQVLNERAALSDEVSRLRERVSNEASATMRPEDAHLQAVRVLSQAQQTADQYVAEAERYGRDLAAEARRHRDEILGDARTRAVQVLEGAHQQAAMAAAAVPVPAAPDPSNRQELERELAYLRTYSEVYRTHLRSYLEALLRNVDEWERSERGALTSD